MSASHAVRNSERIVQPIEAVYIRIKPSISLSAQSIAALIDLPDCVHWAIIFMIVAWRACPRHGRHARMVQQASRRPRSATPYAASGKRDPFRPPCNSLKLNRDPLDLVARNLVAGPVVKPT